MLHTRSVGNVVRSHLLPSQTAHRPMHGFFSKVLALGVVAAGFYFTGDLGWVMDRAGSWAHGESSPPPTAADPAEASAATVAAPASAVSSPPAVPAPLPASPSTPSVGSTPPARPEGGVTLPQLLDDQIRVGTLRSGDRILARMQHEIVAFDLIDPASREAVEHRHALLAADMATAAALAAPRRVVLPATLAVGQPAAFEAVGGVPAALPPPAGMIAALGIERPLD